MTAARANLRLGVNAVGAVMGGAARHLSPFLGALHRVRPGWSIRVWVTTGHEPAEVPRGVSVRTVPRWGPARRVWWECVELPQVLRRDGADALLSLTNSGPLHSQVPSILYQRNALWFDKEWARNFRGRARVEAVARRQLIYLQMRGSALTVVPSAAMARFLLDWRGAPASPALRVIPHAVDAERFPYQAREWPPWPARPLRLLSVGHAAPHKDQALLVHLVSRLRERGIDVELGLTVERADSPDYVDGLDRERQRLGVGDRVRFLGRVADAERLYGESDAMVFPSRTESFAFPVIEAMASGLPVVASSIAASEELLGGNGWYFPPGDLDGAADAVRRLLDTPARQVARATVHAARIARTHSWPANAASVAAAVEGSLVGCGDARRR